MDYSLHGANYKKTYDQYGIDMPSHIIDFSTNTNVVEIEERGCDIEVIRSIYPDPTCSELKGLLKEKHHVQENQILVTNGSNEGIYLIASIYQGKKVGVIDPTYPEYRRALKGYDVEVLSIQSIEELERCYTCDCVFLCNPNNPTGKYIPYKKLIEFVRKLMDRGVELVIDEAYVDFLATEAKMMDVTKYKGVYILRSLTKTYQLAGVRIGYVISCEENIKKLQKRQPTWSVNGIAQQLAYKYLQDDHHVRKTRLFYKDEAKRVMDEVKGMGHEVMSTDVNYFLVRVDDDERFIRFMLEKGIVLRHTRNHIGLDGKYVRVAVRTRDENNQLLGALELYENILN